MSNKFKTASPAPDVNDHPRSLKMPSDGRQCRPQVARQLGGNREVCLVPIPALLGTTLNKDEGATWDGCTGPYGE